MARLLTKFWLLERYLFGQMLTPVLTGVAGGTLLLLVGRLFTLAERLVEGSVPPLTVLRLLVLDLPEMVVLGMPIAAFFATMLTLGKLSGNSEITAMRAAGIPFSRIFRPLLLVGLAMSLSAFFISNVLLPASKQQIRQIDQQALLAQTATPVQYDVFFKTEDNLWFFIRQVDPRLNTMQDVTILRVDPLPGGKYQLAEVTLAAQAVWNGLEWSLSEGATHLYGPTGLSIAEQTFHRKPLQVSQDLAALMQPPVPPQRVELAGAGRADFPPGPLQSQYSGSAHRVPHALLPALGQLFCRADFAPPGIHHRAAGGTLRGRRLRDPVGVWLLRGSERVSQLGRSGSPSPLGGSLELQHLVRRHRTGAAGPFPALGIHPRIRQSQFSRMSRRRQGSTFLSLSSRLA